MIPYLSLRRQVEMAVLLERLGFDTVWWPDHLLYTDGAPGLDCWTTMAAAATRTRRILLGTAVSDPHRVHPAVFAQRAATLDQLSRGRLLLGLGSGESMNLDPFGFDWRDRKVGRLREFITAVRALLDGSEVNHAGPYHRFKQARLTARPHKNREIPIYVAALGPQMQRLTGELAQGWLPVVMPSRLYAGYFEPIAVAARQAGRDPGAIDRIGHVALALLEEGQTLSTQQLATVLRPYAGSLVWGVCARQAGLPFEPPPHLAEVGYHTVNPCDPESLGLFKEYCEWVPAETMADFALVGDKHAILKGLQAYVRAGVTHFELLNGGPDPLAGLVTLAHDIMPHLTGRPPTLTARALNLALPFVKRAGLTRRLVPPKLDAWKRAGL